MDIHLTTIIQFSKRLQNHHHRIIFPAFGGIPIINRKQSINFPLLIFNYTLSVKIRKIFL